MQITTFADFRQRYTYNTKTDKLGEGGFGIVYKAFDTYKHHYCALKVCQVREGDLYSLRREVEIAAALPAHPNIASYESQCYRFEHDFGGMFDFAVMQYYPEGNLSNLIGSHKIAENTRHQLVLGILRGLAFLHDKGIIHRDLKPSNILVVKTPNGDILPLITDFGISKLSSTGNSVSNSGLAFSLQYMSPEQATFAGKIDRRSDIWAVGALVYFICTGRHAFASDNPDTEQAQSEIRKKVAMAVLPDDTATIALPYRRLIESCLVLEPEKRAASAAALLAILENAPQAEIITQVIRPEIKNTRLREEVATVVMPIITPEKEKEVGMPIAEVPIVAEKKRDWLVVVLLVVAVLVAVVAAVLNSIWIIKR